MTSFKLVLTQALVDAVQVPSVEEGRLLVYDKKLSGLVLIVRPTGLRTWTLRYRPGGRGTKDRWAKVANGGVPLKEVRDIARRMLGDVAKAKAGEGQAPHEKRDTARRTRQAVEAIPSTLDAYREWLRTLTDLKPRVRDGYRALFERHAGEALGAMRVDRIEVAHINGLKGALQALPITFNRLRARLRTFFKWCIVQRYRARGSNPTDDVKPYKEESKDRPLSREELTALQEAIARAETVGVPVPPERQGRASGAVTVRSSRAAEMRERRTAKGRQATTNRSYTMRAPRGPRGSYATPDAPARLRRISPTAAAALRFLLLTGWREQEALTLQWTFVDFEAGTADLPRTKGGRSLRPLSDAALDLLNSLPRIAGNPFAFPSARARRDGTVGPITDLSAPWYAVRHAAGVRNRLHDLRHTVASQAVSNGVDLNRVGAMLGHKDQRSTLIYAKYSMQSQREAANAVAAIMDGTRPGLRIA